MFGFSVMARSAHASSTEVAIAPGVTQAEVAQKLDALVPGDTLTLAPGDYSGIDLDLQHKDGSGIAGTESAPITIVGTPDASGNLPHIIAAADNYQEAVRLRSGSAYIKIQKLHLSAKGSQTQAGILIDSGVNHIEITDDLIEDVAGIGIQIQTQSDVSDILVEHNEI